MADDTEVLLAATRPGEFLNIHSTFALPAEHASHTTLHTAAHMRALETTCASNSLSLKHTHIAVMLKSECQALPAWWAVIRASSNQIGLIGSDMFDQNELQQK